MKIFIFVNFASCYSIKSSRSLELKDELYRNLPEYNMETVQRDDCFVDLDLIFKVTSALLDCQNGRCQLGYFYVT